MYKVGFESEHVSLRYVSVIVGLLDKTGTTPGQVTKKNHM